MTVVQPNDMHNEEKVRRWTISKEELQSWIPIFREAALDTIYKWDEFYPDKDSCYYCPASGVCDAERQYRIDQCKLDFIDGIDTEQIKVETPKLGSLSYNEIGAIVRDADSIKKFVDNVCSFAKSLLDGADENVKNKIGKKLVVQKGRKSYCKTQAEIREYLELSLIHI